MSLSWRGQELQEPQLFAKRAQISHSQSLLQENSVQISTCFFSRLFGFLFFSHPTSITPITPSSPRFPRADRTVRMEGSVAQSRAAPSPTASARTHRRVQNHSSVCSLPLLNLRPKTTQPAASPAAMPRSLCRQRDPRPSAFAVGWGSAADGCSSYPQLFAVGVRWRVWTRDMGFPVNLGDAALHNEGHAASAGSSRLLMWDGCGMEMLRHSLPTRFPLPSKKEE